MSLQPSFQAIPPKYRDIVKPATYAAGALGTVGVFNPALDVAGVTTIWGTMISAIALESGHPLKADMGAKIASACVAGILSYGIGSRILTGLLHIIPGGSLAAMGINGTLNALYTYRIGKYAAIQFRREGFQFDDLQQLGLQLALLLVAVPTLDEVRDLIEIVA